jgi:hypothetical protein
MAETEYHCVQYTRTLDACIGVLRTPVRCAIQAPTKNDAEREARNHLREHNVGHADEAYPVHSGPSICSSGGVVAVRAGQAH